MTKPVKSIVEQKFGRLLVVNGPIRKSEKGIPHWECRCDCGETVLVSGKNLRDGHTQSCGCLRRETSKETILRIRPRKARKERSPKSRLYRIWEAMRQRCNNPNRDNYCYYGGRGIRVCPEWDSFRAFEKWSLAHGYQEDLSIDRINNDDGYSPDNCRWVTMKVQAANKRKPRPCAPGSITETGC